MKFTKKEYNRYVADLAPKSPLAKDLVCSFCIGGLICALGQLILNGWKLAGLDADSAGTATSVSLIFISAVLTGLSIYDDIAKVAGAGTIVPITASPTRSSLRPSSSRPKASSPAWRRKCS